MTKRQAERFHARHSPPPPGLGPEWYFAALLAFGLLMKFL